MTAPVRSTVSTSSSVDEVFDVLTSAGWVERRASRFRDGSTLVRREQRPDGALLVEVSRELPQGAPGFLTRFLPADGRVLQTDEWAPPDGSGTRSGTWQVVVPGAPARMGGTLRVQPSGTGCDYVVQGEVRVSVPLVGGRAEAFLADVVARLGRAEGELLQQALRS
ncbi:MAG: hypothetical protein AVDCRST_MAG07-945 [uncultured Frankineae bacterium]|uniref:DUF2505 domain-containing protein n=1 Tax=uncultured Frankineae bacterium TaxID=437475 RepID=A0A6J4KWI2_9ACTN|nr:MAG: hypothetical protein AVDCRST_MAG07-945 [uncultured Frankineae bacterium]